MEKSNIVTRRRKDRLSSFLGQELIHNDHLLVSPPSLYPSRTSPATREEFHYVPPLTKLHNSINDDDDPNNNNANYYHSDHFLDHPTTDTTSISHHDQQEDDTMLYLSTPRPMTIGRLLRTQTPARTASSHVVSIHDSLGTTATTNTSDQPTNFILQQNPPFIQDLAYKLCFPSSSYGCMCCQCVRTAEIGIFESCGKYQGLAYPGYHCLLLWPLTNIMGRLSTRINQLEVTCETKTSDSVFCKVSLAVPFRVIEERADHAYYRLTDPRRQIETHVFDVVRSTVPRMTLDELFRCKTEIAREVDKSLRDSMMNYGYRIMNTLVIDIRPEEKVVQAMNEVNASKRLKLAMMHIAEAEKIKKIKEAEAHAEAMYLHGVGISGKQRALAKGLKSTIHGSGAEEMNFTTSTSSSSRNQITNLVLIAQYNDLITSLSTKDSIENTNLILPIDIAQIAELTKQVGAYYDY